MTAFRPEKTQIQVRKSSIAAGKGEFCPLIATIQLHRFSWLAVYAA
jgi:hypothetical protein